MNGPIFVVLIVSFLTAIFIVTNGNLIVNPNVFGDSEMIIKIKGSIDGIKAPSERLGQRNDEISINELFEMQMRMNKLAQLSEMSAGVVSR